MDNLKKKKKALFDLEGFFKGIKGIKGIKGKKKMGILMIDYLLFVLFFKALNKVYSKNLLLNIDE